MRKIIILIFSLFILLGFSQNVKAESLNITKPTVTDHEKIKVYIFRGEGCTHCHDFLVFFNQHAKEFSKYFEIVAYESWKDNANVLLREKVNNLFEVDKERQTSVPLIIVGDWHTFGFSDTLGSTIIEKALESYQNDEYEDLVAKLINSENLRSNPETLKEACEKEGIIRNDGLIIAIIFIVMVGGVAALAFFAKKK